MYAPAPVDGKEAVGEEDGLVFRALPRLSTTAVADVLQVARVRILGYLQRRGVIEVDQDALRVSDELAARDPALAQLTSAA